MRTARLTIIISTASSSAKMLVKRDWSSLDRLWAAELGFETRDLAKEADLRIRSSWRRVSLPSVMMRVSSW